MFALPIICTHNGFRRSHANSYFIYLSNFIALPLHSVHSERCTQKESRPLDPYIYPNIRRFAFKPKRNRAVKILTHNFDNLEFEFMRRWAKHAHKLFPKLHSKSSKWNCSPKCNINLRLLNSNRKCYGSWNICATQNALCAHEYWANAVGTAGLCLDVMLLFKKKWDLFELTKEKAEKKRNVACLIRCRQ